jgi:ketosteroid isomerase-like protein
MKLYAPDGVFMAQNFPTATGTDEVRKAYDVTFNMITLSVEVDILEVVPITEKWAFARTASAGTVKVNTTGGGGPEANQELFVMQKIDGAWKIARYCFSTTNPPH